MIMIATPRGSALSSSPAASGVTAATRRAGGLRAGSDPPGSRLRWSRGRSFPVRRRTTHADQLRCSGSGIALSNRVRILSARADLPTVTGRVRLGPAQHRAASKDSANRALFTRRCRAVAGRRPIPGLAPRAHFITTSGNKAVSMTPSATTPGLSCWSGRPRLQVRRVGSGDCAASSGGR